MSSDGNAGFEPKFAIDLNAGESISWQSMPGTPQLPDGSEIVGQSYRLDAFSSDLVDSGQIKIQFAQPGSGGSSIVAAIYFWDGTIWQLLPTTIGEVIAGFHADGIGGAHMENEDGIKLASSPSQGVGVYAVLTVPQRSIFLPLIQR